MCGIALAAAVVASGCAAPAGHPTPHPTSRGLAVLSRGEALVDERVLLGNLRAAHPDLFFARSRRSVDADVRAIERRFGTHVTRAELLRALAPLVASFRDGHTFVDPQIPEYIAYRDRGGRLFPLEIDCVGKAPVVVADFGPEQNIPVGAVVESIGGISAAGVIDHVGRYESGDRPGSLRYNTCTVIRTYFWLDGVGPPYAISYRTRGSAMIRRVLRAGTTLDRIRRWDDTPAAERYFGDPSLRFEDGGAIAVLTMHAFDLGTELSRFLDGAFRRLRERRTRALLIDVRQNRGGDLSAAGMLMDRITDRPYRLVAESETKVSALVRERLGPDEYVERYGDEAVSAPDGTLLRERFSAQPVRPVAERFHGRTYVLVGSGTFSSAAMFAAAVQDARAGTILGQPSGGNATNYGERFDFTLPMSGLEVSVSTKRFVRPNEDARLGPVIPDKRFAETAPVGQDDELRSALDFIRSVPDAGRPVSPR